ncbi:PDZ domain-containing protein [Halosquirtibacter xylanolyticus]|uniref:PDZ domain-containing protein n=1 Tax=Halosquirtibacter xylanolyticus TaxID=3374599 RepID=UPI00374951E6|nr:PDZ domain-containing protein [Prolixibacteraceae bacterium]
MNTPLFFIQILLLISLCSGCKHSKTLIVDNNSTDSYTLTDAFTEASRLKELDDHLNIQIIIKEGTYYLDRPISITPVMSGLSIIGQGLVEIKGSRILKPNWKIYNDKIMSSNIKNISSNSLLFVDNQKQILARYPNYNEKKGPWQGWAADAISKERVASWKNPKGAIFNAMHRGQWGDFHYTITGVDDNGKAILSGGQQNNRASKPHIKYRMIENIFEELDSPKEWFFNRQEQKLYLWETTIMPQLVEVSNLDNLIHIEGTENNPVKNISIEGVQFSQTNRTYLKDYEPLLRSDWTIHRDGAIYMKGAEKVSINRCTFKDLGGNVVFIDGYNRDHHFSNNLIHDCGATAFNFVGDPSAVRSPAFQYYQSVDRDKMDTLKGPKNNHYPMQCVVDNNLIYRIGRIEKQTAGVNISMSRRIKVDHNTIYDVPRAAINICDGTWGGHQITNNDAFNTVLETSDHGAFNSWGRDRFWHPNRGVMNKLTAKDASIAKWDAIETTTIANNRFRCDHGWDIDLDDGSSNYIIENNLCLSGGIKLREGFYRTVRNNITLNNGFHPHVWFSNSHDSIYNNIFMSKHKDIRLQAWGDYVDKNIYTDKSMLVINKTKGVDNNSGYSDDIRHAIEKKVFNFDQNLLLDFNFINFDTQHFGVTDPKLKELAKKPNISIIVRTEQLSNDMVFYNWKGAKVKQVTSLAERSAAGLPNSKGIIIVSIKKESPADSSDLQVGDVITNIENYETSSLPQFIKAIGQLETHHSLKIKRYRNQKQSTVTITNLK